MSELTTQSSGNDSEGPKTLAEQGKGDSLESVFDEGDFLSELKSFTETGFQSDKEKERAFYLMRKLSKHALNVDAGPAQISEPGRARSRSPSPTTPLPRRCSTPQLGPKGQPIFEGVFAFLKERVLPPAGTGYGDSQMQDDAYGYTPAPPTDPTSIDREFICDVLGRVAENQAFAVQLLCRVHKAKPDAAEDNLFARLFRQKEYYDSEWANELLDNLRVDTDFEDGRTILLKTASVLRVNSGRRVQRDEIREKMIEVVTSAFSSFKGMAISLSRDAPPPTRADTETQEWEVKVGSQQFTDLSVATASLMDEGFRVDQLHHDTLRLLGNAPTAIIVLRTREILEVLKSKFRLSKTATELLRAHLEKEHSEFMEDAVTALLGAVDEDVEKEVSELKDHVKVNALELARLCSPQHRAAHQELIKKLLGEDNSLEVRRAAMAAQTGQGMEGMTSVKYWMHCTSPAAMASIVQTGIVRIAQCDSELYDGKLATDKFAPLGLWFSAYTYKKKLPKTTAYPEGSETGYSAGLTADVSKLLGLGVRWKVYFVGKEKIIRTQYKYAVVMEGSPEDLWFQHNPTITAAEGPGDRAVFLEQDKDGNWLFFAKDLDSKGEDEEYIEDSQADVAAVWQVETSVFFVPPNGRDLLLRDAFVSADTIETDDYHWDPSLRKGVGLLDFDNGFSTLQVKRSGKLPEQRPRAVCPALPGGSLFPPKVNKQAEFALAEYNKWLSGQSDSPAFEAVANFTRHVEFKAVKLFNSPNDKLKDQNYLKTYGKDGYQYLIVNMSQKKPPPKAFPPYVLADQLLRIASLGYHVLAADYVADEEKRHKRARYAASHMINSHVMDKQIKIARSFWLGV